LVIGKWSRITWRFIGSFARNRILDAGNVGVNRARLLADHHLRERRGVRLEVH
jgi:hypothetical protein